MAPRTFRLLKWSAPLLLAAALVAFHPIWMRAMGRFLVRAEEPSQADMVVVLAGDLYGHRIVKGAELVRQGFAPRVLVSGPEGNYGYYECELAIPFAVKRGYPQEWFIPLPIKADSTREEARIVLRELHRRNVRRFLIVTSDYHTRRAGSVYRAQTRGMELRIVAAPDEHFRPDTWWWTRPGRKTFSIEWLKTVGDWIGL